MEFRWIEWNVGKVLMHGVTPPEAEQAVIRARRPYPRRSYGDRWLVRGQTDAGRYVQVVFLADPDETVFVIHARPLTEVEKRKLRRRTP